MIDKHYGLGIGNILIGYVNNIPTINILYVVIEWACLGIPI